MKSEWTPGVGDGQGGLACFDSWGCKESETTKWLNWTECHNKSLVESLFLTRDQALRLWSGSSASKTIDYQRTNPAAAAAAKSLQSCLTLRPHRWQPIRLPCPWDSPGKKTGVGCHFLLQGMKVKSLSCVLLLATPWTAAHLQSIR